MAEVSDLLKQGRAEQRWDRYLAHSKLTMEKSLCEVSQSELQKIQKKAFRRFYFRSKYIWRKLLALRSPSAFFGMLRGVYMIILFHTQTFFDARQGRR